MGFQDDGKKQQQAAGGKYRGQAALPAVEPPAPDNECGSIPHAEKRAKLGVYCIVIRYGPEDKGKYQGKTDSRYTGQQCPCAGLFQDPLLGYIYRLRRGMCFFAGRRSSFRALPFSKVSSLADSSSTVSCRNPTCSVKDLSCSSMRPVSQPYSIFSLSV